VPPPGRRKNSKKCFSKKALKVDRGDGSNKGEGENNPLTRGGESIVSRAKVSSVQKQQKHDLPSWKREGTVRSRKKGHEACFPGEPDKKKKTSITQSGAPIPKFQKGGREGGRHDWISPKDKRLSKGSPIGKKKLLFTLEKELKRTKAGHKKENGFRESHLSTMGRKETDVLPIEKNPSSPADDFGKERGLSPSYAKEEKRG